MDPVHTRRADGHCEREVEAKHDQSCFRTKRARAERQGLAHRLVRSDAHHISTLL